MWKSVVGNVVEGLGPQDFLWNPGSDKLYINSGYGKLLAYNVSTGERLFKMDILENNDQRLHENDVVLSGDSLYVSSDIGITHINLTTREDTLLFSNSVVRESYVRSGITLGEDSLYFAIGQEIYGNEDSNAISYKLSEE